ncbi:hypothetical protein N9891_00300 [bacterium]|nr:hypothetical protein [bacterium]
MNNIKKTTAAAALIVSALAFGSLTSCCGSAPEPAPQPVYVTPAK